MTLRKAVFLDRDGTLNKDTGYLHDFKNWQWLPGVREGLKRFSQAGYLLIIASNQSGIARGLYEESDWHKLNKLINLDLAAWNTQIDAFYFCPHHPDYTASCECRKPKPGMLVKAAADFGINLKISWLIGDKASDIHAALNAGVKPLLVETGAGKMEKNKIEPDIPVCPDFASATNFILNYDN